MSLITWLPLISDTHNQGISNSTITTNGTALTYTAGKLGTAATFNNSTIIITPAPLNTNTTEFSFAFWYKPTTTNSYQCLYNGRNTTGAAIAIFRDPSNYIRFDDGSQTTFSHTAVLNEWHHYVLTRDASNKKLYIDGVLKQTVSSRSFTCSSVSATIGRSSYNGNLQDNYIYGQLQDYRIYDHVLSVKEIKELAKGLVMHLPLDWGDSTRNPDSSSENYTALDFGTKYLTDCSGFNRVMSSVGSPINGGDSVRYTSCTYFDGSDDGIKFTDASFINMLGGPFTISFWVKSTGENNNRSVYFGSYIEGGTWAFNIERYSNNLLRLYWNANPDYRISEFTITEDEWIHIAIVKESDTSVKFYKNGVLVSTKTSTHTAPSSGNTTFYIARDGRTGTTCYKGCMSDFRFYGTALTAEDVQQVYKIPFSIDSTGKFYGYNLVEV